MLASGHVGIEWVTCCYSSLQLFIHTWYELLRSAKERFSYFKQLGWNTFQLWFQLLLLGLICFFCKLFCSHNDWKQGRTSASAVCTCSVRQPLCQYLLQWLSFLKLPYSPCIAVDNCAAHLNCCSLHQDCNHVAAVLFRMDAAWKAGLTDPSCTTAECKCNKPAATRQLLQPCRIRDMTWDKPRYANKGMPAQL